MGRRAMEYRCARCGKRINGSATECIGCLRLFHSACLQRVKLKNKRPSYMLCDDCISDKPIQRVFVGPPKEAEAVVPPAAPRPGIGGSPLVMRDGAKKGRLEGQLRTRPVHR